MAKSGRSITLDHDIWAWVDEQKGKGATFINKILRERYELVKNPTLISQMKQYKVLDESGKRIDAQKSELEDQMIITNRNDKKMFIKQKEADEKMILAIKTARENKEKGLVAMVGKLKGIAEITEDMPMLEQVDILRSKNPEKRVDRTALNLYWADKKVKK